MPERKRLEVSLLLQLQQSWGLVFHQFATMRIPSSNSKSHCEPSYADESVAASVVGTLESLSRYIRLVHEITHATLSIFRCLSYAKKTQTDGHHHLL